jgi:hypothetical protein
MFYEGILLICVFIRLIVIKYLKYKSPQLAYRNISFEREAYDNEHNLDYLGKRKFWHFIKYI